MLHLAVIGIVCAVSAPIEGTEFTEWKNNDSNVHCVFDGGNQSVVSLPNAYDVVIRNTSDCGHKFTNRTSSLFYEYFIKQYRDSKNTSCSIMESVSSGKKKRFPSKGDFPSRKKRSLYNRKRAFETKTLMPPIGRKDFCQFTETPKKSYDPRERAEACLKKIMKKGKVVKNPNKTTMTAALNHKSDLNFQEKKMFFRLKNPTEGRKICKGCKICNAWNICKRCKGCKACKGCKGLKRHLDRLEVDDELDLNKRIEKLVEKIALENQRKESTGKDLKLSDRIQEDDMEGNTFEEKPAKKPASFLNHIRKMFSFSKNYFNNIGVNSVPVDSAQDKGLVADKSSHISSYDLLKTMRKTARFRRSYPLNQLRYTNKGNTALVYENDLTQKSHPFSANFKRKSKFLHRRRSQKLIHRYEKKKRHHQKRKVACRRGRKLKNWPLFKKFHFHKGDGRLRRDDPSTSKSNEDEKSTTEKEGTFVNFDDSRFLETEENPNPFLSQQVSINNDTKGYETDSTVSSTDEINMIYDDTEEDIPDHTLEKPSLEEHFGRENYGKTLDHSTMTEIPSHATTDLPIYSSQLPKENYLTADRYLQIRHALRSYLIHNNILFPVKQMERKKRCGMKGYSRPRKCWRAAPLLCIPYIKKGQDDQLRYLIKLMQNMLGKPFPPKTDIFERTKFKPSSKKFLDYPEDDYADYPDQPPYRTSRPPPYLPMEPYPPPPNYLPAPVPLVTPQGGVPTTTSLVTCAVPTCPPPVCSTQVGYPGFNSPTSAINAAPYKPYSQLCDSATPTINQEFTGTEMSPRDFSFSIQDQSTNYYDDFTATTYHPTAFPYTPIIPTTPLTSNDRACTTPAPTPYISLATPSLTNTPSACTTSDGSSFSRGISEVTTAAVHKFPSIGNGYRFVPGLDTEVPFERREYYSFATFTDVGDERENDHVSEAMSEKPPLTQSPPFPLCKNQNLYPERSLEAYITTLSSTTEMQTTPHSPVTLIPMRSTINVKSEMGRPGLGQLKEYYPKPYYTRSGYKRPEHRKPLIPRTQSFAFSYEDRFDPPTERNLVNSQMRYQITQNRLFRMRHKGYHTPRQRNQAPNYFDYDFYNRYLFDEPKERYDKQYPPHSWKKEKKSKEVQKRSKSTRHKRGDDYYSGPEGFESYNDYLDDPILSDENLNVHSSGNPETSEEIPDSTPPSYDMLSELAKAMTVLSTPTPSNTSIVVGNLQTTERSETKSENDFKTLWQKTAANHTPSPSGLNKTEMPTLQADGTSNQSVTTSNQITTPSNLDGGDFDYFEINTTEATRGRTEVSTRRKTVFFPSNKQTKPINNKQIILTTEGMDATDVTDGYVMGDSSRLTTAMNPKVALREDKGLPNHNLDSEEGQMPTTLKMANIAKGQKKLVTKPSPKVYTKVFPDSLSGDPQVNETAVATKATTTTTVRAKTTPAMYTTSAGDLKLQILAVCEGYLEVIKLMKAQNYTPGEDLDMDLARYCENIISQSFNYQSEKSKKPDTSEPVSQIPILSGSPKPDESPPKQGCNEVGNDLFENEVPDKADDSVTEKELVKGGKKKMSKKKKRKNSVNLGTSSTDTERSDETEKRGLKKKKKKRKGHSSEKREEKLQITDDTDLEKLVTKGVTQEQMELINLLKKRKEALLSWLLNSKDDSKPSEMQETEYLDDEDMMEPGSDAIQDSGTIRPKTDEKTSGTTGKKNSFVNESIFPIYAKQYGYDSGGEVREVEVLWRKINEKTNEKKIFKNVSVLALLLTSTYAPDLSLEDSKLYGYEGEEISGIQSKCENKVNFAADPFAKFIITSTALPTALGNPSYPTPRTNTSLPAVLGAGCTKPAPEKSPKKNATHTFITKPDASTFVGRAPNVNKTHRNITRKVSHRFGVAKDIFQEYSIEFLNYAVYILPVMFTILFLFCCLCCAVHIFYTRKKLKKKKKKKKRQISSEETTETTDDSEFDSKKRKREAKRKRICIDGSDDRHKKFNWNVLKLRPCPGECKSQSEKRRSFLRFLKARKEEGKFEGRSRFPLCEPDEVLCSEEKRHNTDDQHASCRKKKEEERSKKDDNENEAAERRELIALLEELKKIETEHTEEKKEVKSVHVQYVTQEDDKSVFQRPDVPYPYQENVFGLPKGYSFCSKQTPIPQNDLIAAGNYELYDGVNELTELLPCECGYLMKTNDYFKLKQEGRCKRFLKIFQDPGVTRDKPFVDQNCRTNESENRRFIFNKYRGLSREDSDGLMGVTYKNAGTEVRFVENASPFTFRPQNNANLVEEMENFKRQLNKKKHVRLKDDGVLCRL